MQSPFYRAIFNTRLSEDRQSMEQFDTTAGGARRGVSMGGAITGRGADIIIIDDPMKAAEGESATARLAVNRLYWQSLSSRLNRDTGATIIIMQRLHANDLTGSVQKTKCGMSLPCLPSPNRMRPGTFARPTVLTRYIAPRVKRCSRFDSRRGPSLRAAIRGTPALLMRSTSKNRTARKGHVIDREWLLYYDANSKPSEFDTVLQSWDTGSKSGEDNSYSVCTTWGIRGRNFYLQDVYRSRPDFRELKTDAMELADHYKPSVILIEAQSMGVPLAEELSAAELPADAVPTGSASKRDRLIARSNRFEGGLVFLRRDAPWLEAYIAELTTFPDSEFSDQVNSTTQALAWDTQAANSTFTKSIQALNSLAGNANYGGQKMVKLRVKIGGGTVQFSDGRPNLNIPGAGEIFEIDEEAAARLASDWQKYERIPD